MINPHNLPRAFLKQWEDDPYAIKRTAALSWLGDRYLLAVPANRKLTERFFQATIKRTGEI